VTKTAPSSIEMKIGNGEEGTPVEFFLAGVTENTVIFHSFAADL
jgi:hypothetical protein